MDSPYSRLAGIWDELFPPDPERIDFIKKSLKSPSGKGARSSSFQDDQSPSDPASSEYPMGSVSPVLPGRIIEVGCGSGATARQLGEFDFLVDASDRDSQMIAIAKDCAKQRVDAEPEEGMPGPNGRGEAELEREKSARYAGAVKFSVNDMIGSLQAAAPNTYDAVLCLGNTLSHLITDSELLTFFRHARRVLVNGGFLVVQILNYDPIMRLGEIHLWDLEFHGLIFRRRQFYDKKSRELRFFTEVEAEDRSEQRNHRLNPISDNQLSRFAQDTGFSDISYYKDWNFKPYQGESPWFVAVYR